MGQLRHYPNTLVRVGETDNAPASLPSVGVNTATASALGWLKDRFSLHPQIPDVNIRIIKQIKIEKGLMRTLLCCIEFGPTGK
jgi:predicted 3-demethylubiquinone-9 3-methyltransferase (glyoxalase superfamily)